jgi:L-gulonate 3-dehydrogenase
VADYSARYAGFYKRLAEHPPAPDVWDDANAARVAAALGPPAAPTVVERRMRWRDRRLMALVAHKRAQPDSETKE